MNLKALYKNGSDYTSKFAAATKAAERAGFILKADAERLLGEAKSVEIGQ